MRALADHRDIVPPSEHDAGEHRSVAVVGAGITGLVAAYELRRRGVNVTLYEASGHAGGAIRTSHTDGFLAEHGPNSFVTSAPVEALIAQLDLADDVVEANPKANRRYIVRNGTLQSFPMNPPAMLATRLFSLKAKLRVLLEPLVRTRATDADESVASFVRRRLGPEVLDYAVDPFISGIFAGDTETLSMMHAFPRVFDLERRYGSLSAGLMATRGKMPPAPADASDGADVDVERALAGPPTRARLISFVDGMQTLTDALEASLVGTLRLGCPVRLLHRNEGRWVVDAGQDGASRARTVDAVVMATPAHVLAAMELPAALRKHAALVERVEYPPMSTLTLGFERADVAHALDGFGMLIPSKEKRSILGALFSSSLFPDRAPDGHVAITCFVGGARMPERAREDTDLLVERVLIDLRQLLGVRGEPIFAKHVYWPRAIPQYTVGYQAVKDAADETELANPGLYLAGNYRNGVSVGDCVASGQQIAQRVATYLTRAG
ncbi:protoporphyrinogen oxidase [Gemmatimonas sp.]|uniref:protoporphyrinogen oxidase n=1 Tax=Gemmatimonas sp. TaxID=1962908 RepID=UPI00286D7E3E|nr:protoporphyrinogen oxidase [Gemmatimonas sp.]